MPALTINNIPEDIYRKLRQLAEQHHRSINNEAIVCLQRSLSLQKNISKNKLNDIQAFRSQFKTDVITTEDIEKAVNDGRP